MLTCFDQPKAWTVEWQMILFKSLFLAHGLGTSGAGLHQTEKGMGGFYAFKRPSYRIERRSLLAARRCRIGISGVRSPTTDGDITRAELRNFDMFLDSHPAIDQDLEKTPALVNDSAYLSSHPELEQFLKTHPGVREEIRENPRIFMNRERQFDRSGRDITRQELQNLDNFLDTHPNIEQDLKKNPKLLNDAAYLSTHPDLKQFLDTPPGCARKRRKIRGS